MTICTLSIVWCSICKQTRPYYQLGPAIHRLVDWLDRHVHKFIRTAIDMDKNRVLLSGYVSRYKPILMSRGR